MNATKHVLTDTEQPYWQLTAIQLVGWTSLPIIATSILVLQTNSFLGAALTILIGNAIMWFIRFGIIAMSYEGRKSALDLAREYLGRTGSYFIAILLLVSTFAWFIAQTTAASTTLTQLITIRENPEIDQFIQVSVLLGLFSTLLCMNGMVLLRRLSIVSFPILLLMFLCILYALPHNPQMNTNPLSLSGLALVLATNLGTTSDMPTFFRHSKSWEESIKALTLTQLISLVFGLASLFLGSIVNGFFEINNTLILSENSLLLRASLLIFIFLTAVCTNVANVYSASVGWELVAPRTLIGKREYLILGLSLTILFILLSNIFSPMYLLETSDSALVNFCLVLVAAYLHIRFRGIKPARFQRLVYFSAWLLSTAANIAQFSFNDQASPLGISVIIIAVTTSLAFLPIKLAKR
jgi:purine-cytosine permease-like protein